ncbi:hypothetical protein GGS26DRAFT_547508 [Hypomontagnella submonticulosa]|nr:hypothetical protein GGS26DRAFT_547508 [Hypomontagnella submonticulosa]
MCTPPLRLVSHPAKMHSSSAPVSFHLVVRTGPFFFFFSIMEHICLQVGPPISLTSWLLTNSICVLCFCFGALSCHIPVSSIRYTLTTSFPVMEIFRLYLLGAASFNSFIGHNYLAGCYNTDLTSPPSTYSNS